MKTEEKCISLYKISCTRANKSKLFCLSFALSLYNISCAREYMSRISVFSCQICLQGIYLMIITIAGCRGFVLVAYPAVRVRIAVVADTYAFVG